MIPRSLALLHCSLYSHILYTLKLTVRPWKQASPKGNFIFQPFIFRGELLVSGRVNSAYEQEKMASIFQISSLKVWIIHTFFAYRIVEVFCILFNYLTRNTISPIARICPAPSQEINSPQDYATNGSGVPKMVGFPNNHGAFLLKIIILGCEMEVPPFKETPDHHSLPGFKKNSLITRYLQSLGPHQWVPCKAGARTICRRGTSERHTS